MSKEKHIEDIARAMCMREHCDVESCVQMNCETTWLAENLYNAGYRKQSEWISVNDDTPKNELERVLVLLEDNDITHTIGSRRVDTDRFVNGKWARWGKWVTHWMPLLEPLKGESHGS